jgi:CBS domain-containing membrane protein
MYVLSPVLVGVLILLAVALIFNNMTANRYYPTHKRYHKIRKRIVRVIKK